MLHKANLSWFGADGHVFQVHGADKSGHVLFRKQLSRPQFKKFLASTPACLIAMEACSTAHHWGREAENLGHTVHLIPPSYVKPFVKRHKNDAVDAEAIVEAALRPSMCSVAVKPKEQQAQAVLFCSRDLYLRQCTQLINALRGHLAEYGVFAKPQRKGALSATFAFVDLKILLSQRMAV